MSLKPSSLIITSITLCLYFQVCNAATYESPQKSLGQCIRDAKKEISTFEQNLVLDQSLSITEPYRIGKERWLSYAIKECRKDGDVAIRYKNFITSYIGK